MMCEATRDGAIAPPSPRPFHRVLRADPLSVRQTLAELRRSFARDCPADALGRLELVLAEVLNNIVEHGIGGATPPPAAVAAERIARSRAVHLLVSAEAGGLRCVITDTGVLLPRDCLAPRRLPRCEPELPEGGFGWYLIQDLASELSYSRAGGRNCLAFRLPIEDGGVVAA